MSALTRIEVLGIPVTSAKPERALRLVEDACATEPPVSLAFANAHTLNVAADDRGFFEELRRFSLVFNDGIGLGLAARTQGVHLPANLNGTDFTPLLLESAAQRDWPVFLLGGRPGVARRAAAQLEERIPGLRVAGERNGYFAEHEADAVAAQVRASGAEVVLVGMGNPAQERWLSRHLDATGARLGAGVGAFFDFTAGEVARAPAWMNRMGLEWLFRMAQEPARMWRRYVVGNPLFLGRVLRARLGALRSG